MAELDVEALKGMRFGAPLLVGSPLWDRIIAALEGGERLRAAAEAVYVDEAGFCHGLGRLRAALEGRE